jgi:hypothetical protein
MSNTNINPNPQSPSSRLLEAASWAAHHGQYDSKSDTGQRHTLASSFGSHAMLQASAAFSVKQNQTLAAILPYCRRAAAVTPTSQSQRCFLRHREENQAIAVAGPANERLPARHSGTPARLHVGCPACTSVVSGQRNPVVHVVWLKCRRPLASPIAPTTPAGISSSVGLLAAACAALGGIWFGFVRKPARGTMGRPVHLHLDRVPVGVRGTQSKPSGQQLSSPARHTHSVKKGHRATLRSGTSFFMAECVYACSRSHRGKQQLPSSVSMRRQAVV